MREDREEMYKNDESGIYRRGKEGKIFSYDHPPRAFTTRRKMNAHIM